MINALGMTTPTPVSQQILDATGGYQDELTKVGVGALAVGAVVLVFKRGWGFFKGLSR